MTREELLAEMEKLAQAGDEKAFEAFTLEHFKEFPEDVQGKILFGFFSETLDKRAGEGQIAEIQQQGLDALQKIEEIKNSVTEGKE